MNYYCWDGLCGIICVLACTVLLYRRLLSCAIFFYDGRTAVAVEIQDEMGAD
jgi:nitrate reductase gamma subunit